VDRRVRACTPAPGAWTTGPSGDRLKLGPVLPRPDAEPLPPGRLRVGKAEVLVGTATHPVELGEVAPSGRRMMAAQDWARGARLPDDAVLGSA
jgi:methionyl-tRNA formyltransferase